MRSPRHYALELTHKHVPEMQKVSGLDHPPHFMPIIGPYFAEWSCRSVFTRAFCATPVAPLGFAGSTRSSMLVSLSFEWCRRTMTARSKMGFSPLPNATERIASTSSRSYRRSRRCHGSLRQPRQGSIGRCDPMHEHHVRFRRIGWCRSRTGRKVEVGCFSPIPSRSRRRASSPTARLRLAYEKWARATRRRPRLVSTKITPLLGFRPLIRRLPETVLGRKEGETSGGTEVTGRACGSGSER